MAPRKIKARIPSSAELANDPSLRWVPYRVSELLWSDTLESYCRFMAYTPTGRIDIASKDGISPLGVDVDPLSVRRPTANYTPEMLRGDENPILLSSPGRRVWRGC